LEQAQVLALALSLVQLLAQGASLQPALQQPSVSFFALALTLPCPPSDPV
tara:strand:+ start:1196 stop:1345 length:150 start_codon:yes stop_codon:yes gene_type:complete